MLAAWALGLGTVLTTVWTRREAEVREALGIPPAYQISAIIPLGWPAKGYGPPRRRPVEEVSFRDRWGEAL
jgi:nitroreductase